MAVDAARREVHLPGRRRSSPTRPSGPPTWTAACGGDAELRGRVEALLAAPRRRPAASCETGRRRRTGRPPATADHADPTERAGAVIGRQYKLVEEIGEGGMGSVWMAQQTEPVKRAGRGQAHQGGDGLAGRCWPGSRPSGRRWR